MHRVGRTARAGKEGNAMIFVTEEERPYIDFLQGRGVPLTEKSVDEIIIHGVDKDGRDTMHGILEEMKRLSMKDR